ncbi:MAG: type II toxin-antitoxin system HicA family toxin [Methanotrichaceae archaeon]
MSKLPVLSAKGVIKVLRKFGFQVHRQTGSHIHLWNEERRLLVTVPNHHELAKGTLISIMKQAKIEREDFLSKLK